MAPTTTRDATSRTAPIHPDVFELAELLEETWPAMRESARRSVGGFLNEGSEGGEEAAGDAGENNEEETGDPAGANAGGSETNEDDLPPAVKEILRKNRKDLADAQKAARDAQAKVKKFEDRDKSELEKATETAAELKETAAAALRRAVAAEKGIPADLAGRLQGDTEEDLAADADRLLEHLKPADGEKGEQRKPGEKFGGGSRGNGEQQELYTEAELNALSAVEVNKNWAKVQRSLRALSK
jgi:hypothetical protein